MLYRILALVLLLDNIPKHVRLPQNAPFIFRLSAPCKSSEQVLMECLHPNLAGLGKLSRTLSKLGYEVQHKQRDVDEWTTDIKKLASDLSNGIVLCKLISLTCGTVCVDQLYVQFAHCCLP